MRLISLDCGWNRFLLPTLWVTRCTCARTVCCPGWSKPVLGIPSIWKQTEPELLLNKVRMCPPIPSKSLLQTSGFSD
ncbi:hypothetical protein CY35_05G009600 [Sphagnum magellanicum]|nr:hypothetical protein CY35_05G009600 [Sphagnum magellanicum]